MLDVERFFDEFGDRYTDSIRRSNPCYDAMLASAFEALPGGFGTVDCVWRRHAWATILAGTP